MLTVIFQTSTHILPAPQLSLFALIFRHVPNWSIDAEAAIAAWGSVDRIRVYVSDGWICTRKKNVFQIVQIQI